MVNETEKVSEKEEEEPSAGSFYKIRNKEDKPVQLYNNKMKLKKNEIKKKKEKEKINLTV